MNNTRLYHKIRKNEIDWIVLDDYSSTISGNLAERAKDTASYPECRVIRENNVRISMIMSLEERGEIIFLKRYKCRGLKDIFKYFFFTSKASSEWETMNRFLHKGIPIALPLAKGEKKKFNCLLDSYLVTKAFADAKPLNSYVEHCLGNGKTPGILIEKKILIKKLAQLVQKIHSEGFFYRDLHAGNVLVVKSDNSEPELYPVDFHKVWHMKKIQAWMRIRDLAQLKNSITASRTDQMRFLREYAKGNTLFSNNIKVNARRIEEKAEKLWRTHLTSRTKRCMVNSSEFSVQKGFTHSLYHNKSFSKEFLNEMIKAYRVASDTGKLEILKKTSKETVAMIAGSHDGKELKVLVKESVFPHFLSALRYAFCKSRAKKYWIASRGLKVRGIETPLSLAFIEKKKIGLPRQNILLTEYIDHALELNDYVLKNFKGVLSKDEVRKKKRFLEEFAKKLRSLHERGIYHADLKSNNILVKEKSDDGWQFYFIDLDRVTFKQSLSFGQRLNNLAQINASVADCITPSDRLKFFRVYARGTFIMTQKKRCFQKILEISRKKITQPYGIIFSPPAKDRT